MRLKLLLLFCLALLSTTSFAQRYDDASSASFSVGILKNGTSLSLSYEKFNTKQSSFVGEFEFISKSQALRTHDIDAKYSNLLLGGKYRRYFELKTLYPYISAGAFIGYENLNNKDDIPQSVIIDRKDNSFIYGITTDAGVEYNLKKISFMLFVNPRYDFNHSEFITSFNLGAKYYF